MCPPMRRFLSTINWLSSHIWYSDIAIAVLGCFMFSCVLQRLTIKGPMLWPVMGILPSLFLHVNNIHDWVTEALIKAGGTFPYRGMWMGGTFGIITVDPSKIEYILKTGFKNFPKGKYYRERFSDLLGDGIFNADGESWKEQRRAATSEIHSSRFLHYSMHTIQELLHQKLLKLLENNYYNNYIDMQDVLLRFTFDNICTAAFGVDPGCLSPHDLLFEIPFAKAFEEATELSLFRFAVPPFVWKTMKLLGVGFERRLDEAVRVVHEFAERTVRDRRMEMSRLGTLSHRSDLLSRLIDEKQMSFSDKFLKDFCISFILAGRDTSSVALAWFFWLIYKHPQVEATILREMDEIIGHGMSVKQDDVDTVMFTLEELKKMVYLQAAISEALRLYPPVPIDFKEAEEDDVFPDGSVVKKGARVLYCIFSMARMESIWGKDCREFKPERWLKDGKFVSENQFKFPVFNAGPRLCVGKKFAYMQMKMVAASVLLRYSVRVVEGHEVVPKLTTTLYMKHGLVVTLEPRFSLARGN